jgi:glyoxylase-like metal-dependent hydrolase (beta-lactamase superfamily II)
MEGSRYPLDGEGRPITGINGLLVRTGDAVVLVDPNSWTEGGVVESKNAVTLLVAGPTIEESLAALEITPGQVTHVLITHGHWDHYSAVVDADGRARFPDATHFFPEADWQAFAIEDERGDAQLLRAHFDPLADAGILELVDGDREVAHGVSLLATPGETPGHQTARFTTPAGNLYYLGDLFHYPAEFVRLDHAGAGRDAEQMLASRVRIVEEAGEDSTLVFTHGVFPAWGELDADRRWRFT